MSDAPGPEEVESEMDQQEALRLGEMEHRLAQARTPEEMSGIEEQQAPLWQLERISPEDYRTRVEQFGRDFAGKPGVDRVVANALGDNALMRNGVAHQIDVANKLGLERVAGFEQPLAAGDKHAVDIVTTDGIAIECKAATGEAISGATVSKGVEQGNLYLESGNYKAAIVVCTDGTLQQVGQQVVADTMFDTNVRVCELRDLDRALAQADQLKLRRM